MKSPIILQPVYQTRVWGGRTLQTLYGRELPGDESVAIGESWDVVDRPEAQSLVVGGEYDGLSLGELWTGKREELFGEEAPDAERFPLLCKILDARHHLSIQVHPPVALAEKLGGEAKSEFWYAAQADPGALWYAGFNPDVTRESFEQSVRDGSTPDCVRQMLVSEGDSLWVPSGRVHALGGGQMIFEIQENSDTTYRVFDWKRSDQDGPKRELHIDKALQCIDFDDVGCGKGKISPGDRVYGPGFQISKICLRPGQKIKMPIGFFVMAVVSGSVLCAGASFSAGDYFLLPANEMAGFVIQAAAEDSQQQSALLCVTWP